MCEKRYTIGEFSKKTGIPSSTIRYYDARGLLLHVQRDKSGNRTFGEADLEWISILECLKSTGMSLADMCQYTDWCREGDATLERRLGLFRQQKEKVIEQIEQLKKNMEKLDYKIWHYQTSLENGHEECTPGGDVERYEAWKKEHKTKAE